jgi:hypothetical protein
MPKYIEFVPDVGLRQNGKMAWDIKNKRYGDILGAIVWQRDWHQYVARFDSTCEFSLDCLADIQAFMAGLKKGEVPVRRQGD